jgi:hypothetical protein
MTYILYDSLMQKIFFNILNHILNIQSVRVMNYQSL